MVDGLIKEKSIDKKKSFYDKVYKDDVYATAYQPEDHSDYTLLKSFIDEYNLEDKKCMEVGCGRGAFQNLVEDYTGLDLSNSVKPYLSKSFIQGLANHLPFADSQFDALWSIHTLEHVNEPELALSEMCRVLKPNGLLYLAPAWQSRSWARDGYPVRPYSDFGIKGTMIKASISIRDTVWYRSMFIFPKRLLRLISSLIYPKPTSFNYLKLNPNYDRFWMADSDACCSIDPYEAIAWFCSRGHICLSYRSRMSRFFFRTGPLIFKINK